MSVVVEFGFLPLNNILNRKLSLPIRVSLKFFIFYKQIICKKKKKEEYVQILHIYPLRKYQRDVSLFNNKSKIRKPQKCA